MARVRFVAVGELLLDVVMRDGGHDASATVTPGGSAALAAAWAAEAGAAVAVAGRVGDDFAGRMVRTALEEAGIEARVTVDRELATGTFLLLDGEVRVDRGARLRPEDVPARLAADVVLVSGYLPQDTLERAVAASADAGWIAVGAGGLAELPRGANAVLADEEEARRLTDAEPEAAARQLGRRVRLACVTRGAEGAVAVLDGELAVAAPAAAAAKQPLGAGDAFAAGLLVALAAGASLEGALARASELGARAAASGPWPRRG